MDGPKLVELLRVAAFQGREERVAIGLHGERERLCLVDQIGKSVRRKLAFEGVEDFVQRQPCRARTNQEHRIDLRREQRELAPDPGDVHAVSELPETILESRPIAEQLLVHRYAEGGSDLADDAPAEMRIHEPAILASGLLDSVVACRDVPRFGGQSADLLPVQRSA